MNTMGVTFGDTAGHLADVLAAEFPDTLVGVEWPDEQSPPPTWMFIRDDGAELIDVVTGRFDGAVIVKTRSRAEHRRVTQRVLKIIFDLQFSTDSPVASVARQVQPYLVDDKTYGSIGVVPLDLIIVGAPME